MDQVLAHPWIWGGLKEGDRVLSGALLFLRRHIAKKRLQGGVKAVIAANRWGRPERGGGMGRRLGGGGGGGFAWAAGAAQEAAPKVDFAYAARAYEREESALQTLSRLSANPRSLSRIGESVETVNSSSYMSYDDGDDRGVLGGLRDGDGDVHMGGYRYK